MRPVLFFFVIAFLMQASPAHAYLDPGTGSAILQALAAVLVAVGGAWFALKEKIREFFSKKKHGDSLSDEENPLQ